MISMLTLYFGLYLILSILSVCYRTNKLLKISHPSDGIYLSDVSPLSEGIGLFVTFIGLVLSHRTFYHVESGLALSNQTI